MKAKIERIKNLADNYAVLLERQQGACRETIRSVIESLSALQGDTVERLLQQLKELEQQLNLVTEAAQKNFATRIKRELEELRLGLADSRIAYIMHVMKSLIKVGPSSLNLFCESLLDGLIEATGAERGFFVSYIPESTEANLIAARNFQTTNLSLEEYHFSRTLLREVFQSGKSLLVEDASQDHAYSSALSIRKYELKSVLAVPLKHGGRTIGALYLENNTLPHAFSREDLQLLESVVRSVVSQLRHSRLLPVIFEQDSQVFFDAGKASKETIGRDPKILALLEVIDRIADSPATVLIEGESGTGKDLVARALHYQSSRRDRPYVAINCAAIPENLLESELFGHEKGSFTGATDRYIGRIEQGDGGTIFLDEIGELAYPLQAKLLRFLQSNEFQRLGGKETIKVNVRVVAATSKDLKDEVKSGKFQDALYYRLNVIPLRLPPLRERKEDIPLLIDHFLDKFSSIYGSKVSMAPDVYEWLKEYPFPGNIRELENLIHRLVALARENLICLGDLPGEILQLTPRRVSLESDPLYKILHTPPADMEELRYRREQIKQLMDEHEQQLIDQAMRATDGNFTEAADILKVHRVTLHRKMKKKEDD
jgi:Nif-specific regulatory protein